ncbi:MAG: hypothetical protein ACTSUX_03630 [Promethearchaeota archaeon]
MIEDKIIRYKMNLEIAKKLATHEYADKEYYQKLASKLEKMLRFYEKLKLISKLNET